MTHRVIEQYVQNVNVKSYPAYTYDDVRPEHKAAVAVLDAADQLYDLKNDTLNSYAYIHGVGYKYTFFDSYVKYVLE